MVRLTGIEPAHVASEATALSAELQAHISIKQYHIILYQKPLKFARVYDIIIVEKIFFYILIYGGEYLDYIYIIVAQTGTKPARLFRFVTKKPYNHVSLSGSEDLSEMYSFCRTYRLLLYPATFNKEVVGKGTLGQFDFIPCEIYRIAVTPQQKAEYNRLINHFTENRKIYSYNYLGLVPLYLKKNWTRDKNFVCSQFVAYIMERIGIPLEKPFSLYTPDDFRKFPNAELYYAGELNCFHDDITSQPEFLFPRTFSST